MRYLRKIITPHLFRNYKFTPQNPSPTNHLIQRNTPSTSLSFNAPFSTSAPSQRVSEIVDEVSNLTLLEVSDLADVLRKKFDIEEMPVMAVMMPGMGFQPGGSHKGGGAGKGGGEEKKEEKSVFDLKLEGYDAAAKIKVIKEVRAFTDLGLKEAKDLVEKAPTLMKKGVTKEEAEKIVQKMKEIGAKVSMA